MATLRQDRTPPWGPANSNERNCRRLFYLPSNTVLYRRNPAWATIGYAVRDYRGPLREREWTIPWD
jgi:hypothetical protein